MRVANYLAIILASTCMYFLDVRNLVYKRIVCVIIEDCLCHHRVHDEHDKSPRVELTHIFTTIASLSLHDTSEPPTAVQLYDVYSIRLDTL